MKFILILLCLLFCSPVHAGWLFSDGPSPLDEAKAKITTLETHIAAQDQTLNRWMIATGCLAFGCLLFFVIGTALGASTRTHFNANASSPRRLERRTPPTLNGRTPSNHVGKAAETDLPSTLAA